jgi:hypothetical protein
LIQPREAAQPTSGRLAGISRTSIGESWGRRCEFQKTLVMRNLNPAPVGGSVPITSAAARSMNETCYKGLESVKGNTVAGGSRSEGTGTGFGGSSENITWRVSALAMRALLCPFFCPQECRCCPDFASVSRSITRDHKHLAGSDPTRSPDCRLYRRAIGLRKSAYAPEAISLCSVKL